MSTVLDWLFSLPHWLRFALVVASFPLAAVVVIGFVLMVNHFLGDYALVTWICLLWFVAIAPLVWRLTA